MQNLEYKKDQDWNQSIQLGEEYMKHYHTHYRMEQSKIEVLKQWMEQHPETLIEIDLKCGSYWATDICFKICISYGLKPYRYKGSSKKAFKVKSTQEFIDNVVWPEFDYYYSIIEKLEENIWHHFYHVVDGIVTKK
jgi:hypothetical protein